MARKVEKSGTTIIVYDDRLIDQIKSEMFNAEYWPNAQTTSGYSGGRGATFYVQHADQKWVLKHYHRGGVVGRVLDDGFLWIGLDSARSVVEFDLLREMVGAGLPVPIAVAARVLRSGPTYRTDLITLRIPDVVPFSSRLTAGPASAEVWTRVGKCVGEFHARGYFHADLSTHNLQIDSQDKVYLLDWDRGRNLAPGNWRQQNLDRLQRSCIKISSGGAAAYTAADWQALLAGYRSVKR